MGRQRRLYDQGLRRALARSVVGQPCRQIGRQTERVLRPHGGLHPHVVGRTERDLAGHAPHCPLNHALALRLVIRLVFHRLELVNRLPGLRHNLFVLGQLRLSSDARVCRVLDSRRSRRRYDGVRPVVFRCGLEPFGSRREGAAGQRRRRKDARLQLRILVVARLFRADWMAAGAARERGEGSTVDLYGSPPPLLASETGLRTQSEARSDFLATRPSIGLQRSDSQAL